MPDAPTITTSWGRVVDLEVLYLGEIEVGRVSDRGGRNDRPRWIFNLGTVAFWKTEKSVDQARTALLAALSDWLRRAGIDA